MKKLVVATLFVIVGSSVTLAQPCKRHVEAAGGFSYCPPTGWTSTLDNRKAFQKWSAPRPTLANFNVRDEESTATLDDYADVSIKSLTALRPSGVVYTFVERASFANGNGMKGVRAVFNYTLEGDDFHVICYMFNGKSGKKLIFVATMPANDTKTTDLMDFMMITLRLEPQSPGS